MSMIPFLVTLAVAAPQAEEAKEVGELIGRLASEAIEEREQAAAKLERLGPTAIPALWKAVESPDAEVSARARKLIRRIEILASFTPALHKAFPKLEARIRLGEEAAWCEAVEEMVEFRGSNFDRLAPQELALLFDNALRTVDVDSKADSILDEAAYRQVPLHPDGLRPFLKSPKGERQRRALEVARRGKVLGVANDILDLLKSDDAETRMKAAAALRNIGTREAIPAFLALLRDPQPGVRAEAARALGEFRAVEAVAGIRQLLQDRETWVRAEAAIALADLIGAQATPELASCLAHGHEDAREEMARRLIRLGGPAMAPAVAEHLKAPEAGLRAFVLPLLVRLAPAEAESWVVPGLRDRDDEVRMAAVEAAIRLKREVGLPLLVGALQDSDWGVRLKASWALARIGGAEAIPQLLKMLEDEPAPYARIGTARALCSLGEGRAASFLLEQAEERKRLVGETVRVTEMNALRHPEVWARLRARRVELPLTGRRETLLRMLSGAAGMRLASEGVEEDWLLESEDLRGWGAVSGVEALGMMNLSSCDALLDGETMRIVPHAEALQEWERWWTLQGRPPGENEVSPARFVRVAVFNADRGPNDKIFRILDPEGNAPEALKGRILFARNQALECWAVPEAKLVWKADIPCARPQFPRDLSASSVGGTLRIRSTEGADFLDLATGTSAAPQYPLWSRTMTEGGRELLSLQAKDGLHFKLQGSDWTWDVAKEHGPVAFVQDLRWIVAYRISEDWTTCSYLIRRIGAPGEAKEIPSPVPGWPHIGIAGDAAYVKILHPRVNKSRNDDILLEPPPDFVWTHLTLDLAAGTVAKMEKVPYSEKLRRQEWSRRPHDPIDAPVLFPVTGRGGVRAEPGRVALERGGVIWERPFERPEIVSAGEPVIGVRTGGKLAWLRTETGDEILSYPLDPRYSQTHLIRFPLLIVYSWSVADETRGLYSLLSGHKLSGLRPPKPVAGGAVSLNEDAFWNAVALEGDWVAVNRGWFSDGEVKEVRIFNVRTGEHAHSVPVDGPVQQLALRGRALILLQPDGVKVYAR